MDNIIVYSDPNGGPTQLGFKCKEYIGGDACGINTGRPLIKRDDIFVGRCFSYITLVSTWAKAVVDSFHGGTYYFRSGGMRGALEFDKDDRHCWVVGGTWSKRALENWNPEDKG